MGERGTKPAEPAEQRNKTPVVPVRAELTPPSKPAEIKKKVPGGVPVPTARSDMPVQPAQVGGSQPRPTPRQNPSPGPAPAKTPPTGGGGGGGGGGGTPPVPMPTVPSKPSGNTLPEIKSSAYALPKPEEYFINAPVQEAVDGAAHITPTAGMVYDPRQAVGEYSAAIQALGLPKTEHVDYRKYVVDNRGTEVDRSQFIADNTGAINTAFENMKKAAYIDPDKYRKDFMKDNYKSYQAVSDILYGARQFLTGRSEGQTNADVVNAALREKLNSVRDKNIETRTQLNLEQQRSVLGERSRVANETMAQKLATILEGRGYEREYNQNVTAAGQRTEEGRVAAYNTDRQNRYNQGRDLLKMGYEAETAYGRDRAAANIADAARTDAARLQTARDTSQYNHEAGMNDYQRKSNLADVMLGYNVNQAAANAAQVRGQEDARYNYDLSQAGADAAQRRGQEDSLFGAQITKHLAQFQTNETLRAEIQRMYKMREINQANAAKAMHILETQGRDKLAAYLAGLAGQPYASGPVTSLVNAGMDWVNGYGK